MSSVDVDATLQSANERLKEAWRVRLWWSTALAVAAHGLLMAFSFTWRLSYEPVEPVDVEQTPLLQLPGFADAASDGNAIAVVDTVVGELVETDAEMALREGPVVSGAELGDLWAALGDRLLGGGGPLPELAEPREAPPEPAVLEEEEAEDSAGADEGAPPIGGEATTIELAELPEPDSLILDRLSALRPELAFMTASAWVLIRNQADVEAFLRRSMRNGRLDPEARGSVSITLWIDRRGSVEWAEISKSSGRNDLDEFTLALFNEIVAFRAARERGVYVSRSVTFSVTYPWS